MPLLTTLQGPLHAQSAAIDSERLNDCKSIGVPISVSNIASSALTAKSAFGLLQVWPHIYVLILVKNPSIALSAR